MKNGKLCWYCESFRVLEQEVIDSDTVYSFDMGCLNKIWEFDKFYCYVLFVWSIQTPEPPPAPVTTLSLRYRRNQIQETY